MSATKVILIQSLDEARRNAEHAGLMIEAQRRIIVSLAAAGSDTRAAKETLEAFEEAQDLRLGHIDWTLGTLDKLPLSDDDAQP